MMYNVIAHKPNILNVIYKNPPSDQLRVSGSSPGKELNKPNQTFLQALNKREKKKFNSERLFQTV